VTVPVHYDDYGVPVAATLRDFFAEARSGSRLAVREWYNGVRRGVRIPTLCRRGFLPTCPGGLSMPFAGMNTSPRAARVVVVGAIGTVTGVFAAL
jgi:hypothetical protein